ncbi:hypothetical protein DVH24_000678, partial [Malus domestica]
EKISDELDKRAKKFLRGAEANLEGLKDKKLKGELAVREELYGKSAQAAAKAEKNYQWLLPSEGGYLETEGIEKTWRIKQESIALHLSMPPNGNNASLSSLCLSICIYLSFSRWNNPLIIQVAARFCIFSFPIEVAIQSILARYI